MQKRLIALFLLAAAGCFAQRGRAEIRGDVGWTGFLDDSAQNHSLVGGALRAYLTRRISVQPEVQYLRRDGSHHDVVLLGSVAFDLVRPDARVVPYFIVGPGLMRTGQGRRSDTNLFVSGGFGRKVFLTSRWYIAPDFRVGWEPHARFSAGVGYVWKR